jgi:signal transduction histidine kinase
VEQDDIRAQQTRANRFDLITRIVDDVAHELKNPLNSIVINLEVLRNRIRGGQTQAALDRTEVIDAELRRLHALLEAMLRLLRPERGNGGVAAVTDLVAEVAALAHAQARVARKQLVIDDIPDDMIVRVRRDSFRFMLLQILHAALQAVGENGRGVRVAVDRRGEAVAMRIEAADVGSAEFHQPADLDVLQRESGIIEVEWRQWEEGTACTLLLLEARELA